MTKIHLLNLRIHVVRIILISAPSPGPDSKVSFVVRQLVQNATSVIPLITDPGCQLQASDYDRLSA